MPAAPLALLWLVAQTVAPAILSYAFLCRYSALRSDLAAALSVAVTPPLVGYLNGLAFYAAPYVLLCAVVAVAAVPRAAVRWICEPFVRFWFAACCLWIAIDSWILVYGRGPMYIWDWRDHYHIAVEMTGAMKQGLWPVFLARGPLLGIWSSHAWLAAGGDWTQNFWVFQLSSLLANAMLLGPVYLWAARDDPRGGERALWAALLSSTIAYNVTYTWPRLWSPALVLTGMWVACEMRRLPGQILAGLILFAAFYAHLSAEVLIPLVGLTVWWATKRLPIAMTVTTAMGVGFWMWATANIVHGPLFETYAAHRTGPHGFLVRTTGHLIGSLVPIYWQRSPVPLFKDPTPFLLQYLSDVGIFALPLFVTALLFRRRGWNRMLIAAGIAAVLGGWIKSFFTFDLPLWLGLLTERFGEMALWLCAAAGAGTFRRRWTGPAWFLVSVVQALVVQGLVFAYNISSSASVINPNTIHKGGGSPLLFLRDTQWGPIVGGVLFFLGGILLIRRGRAMCRAEAWQSGATSPAVDPAVTENWQPEQPRGYGSFLKHKAPLPPSARAGGARPTAQATPWIVGLVVVFASLAGIFWLRHVRREAKTGMQASTAVKGDGAPAADKRTGDAAVSNEPAAHATPEATPQQVRKAAAGTSLSLSFDASAVAANQTPPIIAQGIEIDPTTGVARFPPGAHLAYPDRGGITFDQGSVAFWIRRDGDPNAEFDNMKLAQVRTNAWENRFELNMGQRFLGLVLANSDGVEQSLSYSSMQWTPGLWHHVAITWGNAIMHLYVDGELVDRHTYLGTVAVPQGTRLYIGSRRQEGDGAALHRQPTVSMRPWSVFPNILSPSEVAALRVQTAPPS